jgi:hypothetical protein
VSALAEISGQVWIGDRDRTSRGGARHARHRLPGVRGLELRRRRRAQPSFIAAASPTRRLDFIYASSVTTALARCFLRTASASATSVAFAADPSVSVTRTDQLGRRSALGGPLRRRRRCPAKQPYGGWRFGDSSSVAASSCDAGRFHHVARLAAAREVRQHGLRPRSQTLVRTRSGADLARLARV